jgi:hypothetical protein
MKFFDSMYGKLVKDWRLQEWTQFYHDHYAVLVRQHQQQDGAGDWVPGEWEKRLFCGPYLTNEEISKYVDCEPSTFIEAFDVPLGIYREDLRYSLAFSKEEQAAQRKRYRENYPWPPVAEDALTRLYKLTDEAIENSFNSPLSSYVEGLNEVEANNRLGNNFWAQRKGYCGPLESAINCREYAYLVAKYPSLRHEGGDQFWTSYEGYSRFYQQYVECFANLSAVPITHHKEN